MSALLRIVVLIIGSASRLPAQQYCLSGNVTATEGTSAFRVSDAVSLTLAVQGKTPPCTTMSQGTQLTQTTCQARVTADIQIGGLHLSGVGAPSPQPYQLGAVARTVQQSGPNGTISQSLTTISLAEPLNLHLVLRFPANLLAGTLPAALPSPDEMGLQGASFYMFVMEGEGRAIISYTGQDCAASDFQCADAITQLEHVQPPPDDPTYGFVRNQLCIAKASCESPFIKDRKWLNQVVYDFVTPFTSQQGSWDYIENACRTGPGPHWLRNLSCQTAMADYHIGQDLQNALDKDGCGTDPDWLAFEPILHNCIAAGIRSDLDMFNSTAEDIANRQIIDDRNRVRTKCLEYRQKGQ